MNFFFFFFQSLFLLCEPFFLSAVCPQNLKSEKFKKGSSSRLSNACSSCHCSLLQRRNEEKRKRYLGRDFCKV